MNLFLICRRAKSSLQIRISWAGFYAQDPPPASYPEALATILGVWDAGQGGSNELNPASGLNVCGVQHIIQGKDATSQCLACFPTLLPWRG